MAEERVQRRLAAILAADVVGYFRSVNSLSPRSSMICLALTTAKALASSSPMRRPALRVRPALSAPRASLGGGGAATVLGSQAHQ